MPNGGGAGINAILAPIVKAGRSWGAAGAAGRGHVTPWHDTDDG